VLIKHQTLDLAFYVERIQRRLKQTMLHLVKLEKVVLITSLDYKKRQEDQMVYVSQISSSYLTIFGMITIAAHMHDAYLVCFKGARSFSRSLRSELMRRGEGPASSSRFSGSSGIYSAARD